MPPLPLPPTLTLSPPRPEDADDLLAFERDNRAFFERWINARPTAFYSAEGVAAAIAKAQADAVADQGFQYLARDAQGVLVGRVNLHQLRREPFHCATLGYRVGAAFGGRGVAQAMVRQLLPLAFQGHGLKRLEATARPDNLGSVRVLQRSGFVQFGHARRCLELHGVWHDLLHFEAHAEP
jgi:ribosomal-protein-alanine N-acetyltransferase